MAQFAQEFPEATVAHGRTRKRKDGSYTVRVRHDAEVEVTTVWPEDNRPTDVERMTLKDLEGRLLTLGCIYDVSGYYNPYKPKVSYTFVNLKRDSLKSGELCNCKECLS